MFKLERKQKILKALHNDSRIDVSVLSKKLNVSKVTIRKDLNQLEREGLLLRTHGGAVLPDLSHNSPIVSDENLEQDKHIRQIGLTASELVHDSSTIFIGPGRTCLEVAINLSSKTNISIVTNNLDIAVKTVNHNSNRLLLTGGERHEDNGMLFLTGSRTLDFVSNIFVDCAIISVDGIDFERGYTVSNLYDERIYSSIINNSKETIIVVDSTKFGNVSFSKIADINSKFLVVSDEQTPKDYIEYYFTNNIPIYTSYELESRVEK